MVYVGGHVPELLSFLYTLRLLRSFTSCRINHIRAHNYRETMRTAVALM